MILPLSDLGVTATRRGLTPLQDNMAALVMESFSKPVVVHHGDCIGGDAALHDIAVRRGFTIEIHPPENDRLRAFKPAAVMHPPLPYLARNRTIVNRCQVLLACPGEAEYRIKSGTWFAVKYALEVGRYVILVTPDGTATNPRYFSPLYGVG